MSQLEFEKPILELEGKIAELRNMGRDSTVSITEEIGRRLGPASLRRTPDAS